MVFEGVYGLRCRYRGGMCPESRAGWPRCAAARLSFPVRSGRRRTSNVAAVSARGILPYGGLVCCGRLPAVPEYRMMRPPSSCGNRAGCGAVAGRVSSDGRMGNWGRYAPRQPPGGPLRKDLGIRIRGMEFRLFSADRCGGHAATRRPQGAPAGGTYVYTGRPRGSVLRG